MIKKFSTYCVLLSVISLSSLTTTAMNTDPVDDEKKKNTLMEIHDRYHQVKLCLTSTSVYMQFDTSVRDLINQELEHKHQKDAQHFIDSEGQFLLGNITYLESDKIEYQTDEIRDVVFENGKLKFTYDSDKEFKFEDIIGTDGKPALENFYLEDLELFYLTYKKYNP
ncbi:hypothetical protein [Balneola vulgaris]|uniref:hypothetical protein n=1 Tax=Balneola vulgaris TaxID=287535 RepID=UPI0014616C96|nr:hypothetical protein [Balneola vulgaris]